MHPQWRGYQIVLPRLNRRKSLSERTIPDPACKLCIYLYRQPNQAKRPSSPATGLYERASGNNNILFTGQRRDISNLLQLSDAFVSPSLSEGLPNTVLEAMASGLPVLLSEIPQHKEIFTGHDYQYFFPPTDDVMLSKLMESMINKGPESTSMLDIVHNNYSADIMAERYQEYYKNILS